MVILQGLWAGLGAADMRRTLGDFATRLPLSTRLVQSPTWLWGIPLTLLAGTVGVWFGLASHPRARLVACIILAALAVTALGFTRMALRAPLEEMYENLRP